MFPIALYCLYQMTIVRRNKFSNRKQYKFLNRPIETYVVGAYMTRRIKKSYEKVIYKQDTEETQMVVTSLDKLIKLNNLEKMVPFAKVKLIHDENVVGTFMSLDQTLFTTIKSLKIAGMEEAKVGLLVSHELSYYLLD